MSLQYRYRKQILIGSILLLILLALGVYFFLQIDWEKKEKTSSTKEVSILEKREEEKEKEYILVDIKGQVNAPGTYQIEVGKRVIDVISQAGGLTDLADTSIINLSKKVEDEMVIIIYSWEEVANFARVKEEEKQKEEECKNSSNVPNDACIETTDQEQNNQIKINLNTATKEELLMLPGIGERKAEDIISYRKTEGLFMKIEDIQNVTGIGESLFDQIKAFLTI